MDGEKALLNNDNSNKKERKSWRKKSKLTTPLGKILEQISYSRLGTYIIAVIVISAIYFWIASPQNQGTNQTDVSLLNSIYFSIITFSSLGYGDILPVGFGKVIASLEVLSGIMLVALFVGKVASERQSAILLLLYTSEHQRRLQEFAKGITQLSHELNSKLNAHDHEGLYKFGKQSVRFLASVSSYLSFQANQGGLANFGNVSALRALYRSIAMIQLQTINILKIKETEAKSRNAFDQINERAIGVSNGMLAFHANDDRTTNYLIHIRKQYNDYKNWLKSLEKGEVLMLHSSTMTESLIQRVFEALPAHPWQKNIHKEVAEKLKITNKLAQRCIAELIKRNTWTEFKKNED